MFNPGFGHRKEDMPLAAPNKDGSVWPNQHCPAFTPRVATPAGVVACWYCVYADFHLNRARALDVGLCEWPKRVLY